MSEENPEKDEKKEPRQTRKYVRHHVSRERFVEAWQTAQSTDEVQKSLGMPLPAIMSRVRYYRSKGIPLKQLHSAHSRIDVEGLTALIERLTQEHGVTPAQPRKTKSEDVAKTMPPLRLRKTNGPESESPE